MDSSLAWVVAGVVLIVAELLTGTFYLFVLGVAALVGAGVAYGGGGFLVQVLVAGAIAIAGVFWIRSRKLAGATPKMPSLDVGQPVTLDAWVNRDDRLARVKYRDALWDAIVEGEFRGEAGEVFYIRSLSGNTLHVAKQNRPDAAPMAAGPQKPPGPEELVRSLTRLAQGLQKPTREQVREKVLAMRQHRPGRPASATEHFALKETSMFAKLIVALIVSVAAYAWQGLGVFSIGVAVLAFVIAFVIEGVRVVPQQHAWVVERLGKFHEVLEPGLNIIIPFFDRIAYRHSLKEVPFDVPEQVCITKDNTQLAVDGIVYYQVMDPQRASYGTSDYLTAITQLAQTTLRSEVGKMELDQSLQSRDEINRQIVSVLDEAGRAWGIKVLRYEVKSLTPPESILRAMQQQITAEREKRALIAKSEGEKQQEINVAEGAKQAAILKSEGEKTAQVNTAQGEATALRLVAEATAAAVRAVADAMNAPGGQQAANLKVAELYIGAFGNLAKTNNTMIVPSNLADVSSILATAMTVLDKSRSSGS